MTKITTLSEAIKRYRGNWKISQLELSKEIGISRTHLARIESGKCKLRNIDLYRKILWIVQGVLREEELQAVLELVFDYKLKCILRAEHDNLNAKTIDIWLTHLENKRKEPIFGNGN